MPEVAFKVENLTKQFPGTLAVDNISLELMQGEIHAIVGENGAGKSTFCKMLSGNLQPDNGEMYLFGKSVVMHSPAESLAHGVCMLYQERDMVASFTGIENICLGKEPKKARFFIDKKKTKELAYQLQEKLGIDLPLDVPIRQLGAGTQQMIEILRTFYHDPKFLILDEPTASLGEGEIGPFLKFVQNLRDNMHLPIIYITHKLEEVFAIADKISVFTDGRCVLSSTVKETTMDEVVRAMLRQGEIDPVKVTPKDVSKKPYMLEVNDCTYDGAYHKLGINIRSGEAVGFYGLVGSGRTECVEVVFGLRGAEKTDILLDGKQLTSISPGKMIQKGLILTPEKRGNGILKTQTIEENVRILFLTKEYLSRFFEFIRFKQLHSFIVSLLEKHMVRYSSTNQGIRELSGGNIQKVIIGRSIETANNHVLILDEPTAGIDIGAKNEIYKKIRYLVEEEDKAVVFISSELEEVITVCDRLYVFSKGNVVGEFLRKEFDKLKILELALK